MPGRLVGWHRARNTGRISDTGRAELVAIAKYKLSKLSDTHRLSANGPGCILARGNENNINGKHAVIYKYTIIKSA